MRILVTGAAGFIGAATAAALLDRGDEVVGVDNLNAYYAVALKRARLDRLRDRKGFGFHEIDIADADALDRAAGGPLDAIIHLAAQAGVRYSIDNPFAYEHSNLKGHLSVLELGRRLQVPHVVYASSSSVYGANEKTPFAEDDRTDAPVSFYGATKKANEAMSASYARLYSMPLTGLRFFTVYGPMGRPDMAYLIFTEKMLKGEPIEIFNEGRMGRDFTFIDDIVAGVLAAAARPPGPETAFHRLYNLGNDRPEELMTLVSLLEKELGIEARKIYKGMQKGDVERTWADISRARAELGYDPKTSLADGIARTIAWRKGLERPLY
ncbi:MAG: NAD-dependent epimerase/dehydratase family protein [Parvularculaceae bacterium]|nr:NAD-dependent epimerase/dehydratase family protein [Parvularculaceae bacterium]